jgi:hypothetical protein
MVSSNAKKRREDLVAAAGRGETRKKHRPSKSSDAPVSATIQVAGDDSLEPRDDDYVGLSGSGASTWMIRRCDYTVRLL